MKQRISIKELEPNAYKAIFGLEKYLNSTGLDKGLRNLVNIRASQINGCAYCIEMHTGEALKDGESQKRIFALSAWWESPLFTEKEKMLLAITDEVTLIADHGLTEDTFEGACKFFTQNEIAQIIIQIGAINIWNRIAVSTHMFHE
ncbi:carboxymuconolactone decarboxylase family protein [Algoriphagus boritolerans]|uniref:Alkylhydroperoxidase AhpD family core domain-containing protein n=1 Tax=Algoriphagus boritolerans DSM 17298 = JCM 18970 TaxID=1120964 RepID=A0A1H6APW0_9BACT|nr:carboxymuconolactone decarboxylase family protein [Algoriphagus boritolerans]SEG50753.1 alkylhydroperoxidase AhpD family core domain-containing protein [Algoriphagus boritolerans DSM 17298 = JCM 18970]